MLCQYCTLRWKVETAREGVLVSPCTCSLALTKGTVFELSELGERVFPLTTSSCCSMGESNVCLNLTHLGVASQVAMLRAKAHLVEVIPVERPDGLR